MPESELPLRLPEVESYETTDSGESPLANMLEWRNTTCPCCGGPALRETDTMPQWAGSSWYFLRYTDPHNNEALASPEALSYWMPVDWYNGGMEHTTLHLLYSRFWHKFLYDIGVVPTPEPYAKRTSHGMILGSNHEKMSKSRGNVVNPDAIVDEYGADTMRLYEMFIGDFEKAAPWSDEGIKGCRRFVDRFYNLQNILQEGDVRPQLETLLHQTIKKVGDDIETLKYNTAIAAMMTLMNAIYDTGAITREEMKVFTLLLCPFAPHVCEEVWEKNHLGEGLCSLTAWPVYDEAKCQEAMVEIVVQVNGKLRGRMKVSADITKDEALEAAKKEEKVAAEINGKTIVKEIYVPKKLVNIVVKK
ncbi:MAG: class I tRNA ligase family protein [Acutalibacteraceae bacterium]